MKRGDAPTKVVICDLDNVLFSADRFLAAIKSHIMERAGNACDDQAFDRLYENSKCNISGLCSAIAEQFHIPQDVVRKFFFEGEIQDFIIEGARHLIAPLRSDVRVIIATSGDREFQKSKVERLKKSFPELAGCETIISPDKNQKIAEVIQEHSRMGEDRVIVIDDRADVLNAIYEALPEQSRESVWFMRMKYGKYQDQPLPDCLIPITTEVTSLYGARETIQRLFFPENEPLLESTHYGMIK